MIPTRNRAPILARALQALAAQTHPPHATEVLVCDDGSRDETAQVVAAFAAQAPFPVRHLPGVPRGANAARNRGVHAASGDLLLFVNDDTIATPQLLSEHAKPYLAHPAEPGLAVLGRVTISPEVPDSLFAKLHLDASYALWEGRSELDWRAFYTCNVSLRRRFLLEYGLFDEQLRYHEDVELAERLSHRGLRLLYNPEALGYHLHHLREREYLGVAERDGTALALWYRRAPEAAARIAQVGLPLGLPWRDRLRHRIGDWLLNPATFPIARAAARLAAPRWEPAALLLYRKLYQAKKRRAVRRTLRSAERGASVADACSAREAA